ncbi:MAG: hypothetical protein JWQ98_217 [Chlorobi bacterium]|jgi:hypothetical protein|nr:hypothetical protein [Chlorobiota bacterium]
MRRLSLLSLLLLLGVAACGERRFPDKPSAGDSAARAREMPHEIPVVRDTGYNPANRESFEHVVYMEYAHAGTNVPRHVVDSIIKGVIKSTGDPGRAEAAMNAYMHNHDSIARAALAAKYSITVDSLNGIISRVSRTNTTK